MSEMLLKHFDLLAKAPNGVTRLRELILTLAVQGKLVPQDPNDEPASVLLQRIRAEKDRLIAKRKIKRDKPLPPITEEEKPFDLPPGWEWARGGNLFEVIRGVTYQKTDARDTAVDSHLPLLRANNIRATVNFDDLVYVPAALISSDQLLQFGDFVVCLASGSKHLVGKAAVFPGDVQCSFGAFCGAIRPWLAMGYLSVYLASPLYRSEVSSASAGIGINNLKGSTLVGLCIPVPPLGEQSRTVARVEELMRLCDALEAKVQLDTTQHAQLLHTLLGTLTDSATPEELAANWQRVASHFDLLLDRPEAVDALEKTILQLAVRGLLVPQNPNDEPASVLLQRICAEKDRLIAEGKIKRDKPLPPITDEEKPFELPLGWEWVSVDTLAHVGTGTTPSRDNNAYFSNSGIPWITSGETGRSLITKAEQFVTARALSETSLTLYPIGTLIVAMYGQGKTRGQVTELGIEATTNQACAAIVLVEPSTCHRQFIKLVFEKSYDEIRSLSAGGAQPNLNVGKVKQTPIPLPPLAEQSRIVARVEELRQLCAALRQRLTASRTTQGHLAEALMTDNR